jgi:redox-sensitive bicupin YhaK (pirin superfamily)
MIAVRKSEERGYADHGWLKSYHTFSFASYYDPRFMGFRNLRVINDDFIAGGGGFPNHPHKDMEIVTYVIEGELAHQDSMGHSSSIYPFDVQVMSAGTGITHSEYNPSATKPLKLLQIWLQTNQQNHVPRYDQKSFKEQIHHQDLTMIVSGDKNDPALFIHQDA